MNTCVKITNFQKTDLTEKGSNFKRYKPGKPGAKPLKMHTVIYMQTLNRYLSRLVLVIKNMKLAKKLINKYHVVIQ